MEMSREELRARRREKMRRQRRIRQIILLSVIVILALAILFAIYSHNKNQKRFGEEVYVNGVNVSGMTLEKVEKTLNKLLAEKEFHFIFEDETFSAKGKIFDLKVKDGEIERIYTDSHYGEDSSDFYTNFSLNEIELEDCLSILPYLQAENMVKPEDAYLELKGNQLVVVPEIVGNYIDFDEAYNLAETTILREYSEIDFTTIVQAQPKVMSTDTDLLYQLNTINNILQSSVEYELIDGSKVKLDNKIIQSWMKFTESGKYISLDIDAGIDSFLDELGEKVAKASNTSFNATGYGNIDIPIKDSLVTTINYTAEKSHLMAELSNKQHTCRKPIYDAVSPFDTDTYVEIDITRQTVWMYVDGECIENTPCVTGCITKGYRTPSNGVWYLTYKTTDTYLRGPLQENGEPEYNSHVNYWMPFNGNIGMHDASWRNKFGGKIYKTSGSHGCINLPYNAAKNIYNNISEDTPIIVYTLSDFQKN